MYKLYKHLSIQDYIQLFNINPTTEKQINSQLQEIGIKSTNFQMLLYRY